MASTSGSAWQWKNDVFLSFRGEDTRDNFTSHLHAALCRKSILAFIDDDLKRGDEITPAILKAIRDSKVAVIIFSKDFASSTWCLDEVENIIECHEAHGQIVLPIFYHADPCDVSSQTGTFAEAFAVHEQHFRDNLEKVRRWRAALRKAAHLSGWDSRVVRPEAKLVDEIVKDILTKLKPMWSCGLEGLVGINSHIERIETLLSVGLLDVRIIGIWGMGGIGKTTIAEAVFKKIAYQFEGSCFLANVREESERSGLMHLAEVLLFQTLEDKYLKLGRPKVGPSFIKDMLQGKTVLIVLDDVNNLKQLEFLVGDHRCFGPGSRIIITSRDQQVLKRTVDDIYEVERLANDEALQLFSLNAFKQGHPAKGYVALSNSVVKYAKGNPLALKVLGSFLFGMGKTDWRSALTKLEKVPNKDIQDVLKITYDGLDRVEKDIFLHIACFFKGEDRSSVTHILDGCGFSTDIGLRVLLDKSLVNISNDKLQMHDLLQEMGLEIVRQESKEPSKRSRLWNHEDIYQVLAKNNGTESIEGISLDMSKIKEVHLNPNAFKMMSNLKFLKFYTSHSPGCREDPMVKLSQGLEYLPNELRYLHWSGYPLQSLPANFYPMDLVELKLPHSNIKLLWKGEKHLEKLKEIDLSHSQSLIKTLDPSAAPNLVKISLDGCTSLLKVPSSIGFLSKLADISMRDCKSIMSFPSTSNLKFLETLDLSGCSKLKRFPEVSKNTKYLYLMSTAIKEVPPSVECLDKLIELRMDDCTRLQSVSISICKLKSLEILALDECSSLESFPEILEPMFHLELLCLNGTSIKELPSSIQQLEKLSELSLRLCESLTCLPESICNLTGLSSLDIACCSKLEKLPKNLSNLKHLEFFYADGYEGQDKPQLSSFSCLKRLHIGSCNMSTLPDDLHCLSHVVELDLRHNKFETIPAGIKQLSHLETLDIRGCKQLMSLPELPPKLRRIEAHDCHSLETICGLVFFDSSGEESFTFTNCFKLNQNAWSGSVRDTDQRFMTRVKDYDEKLENYKMLYVRICFPGVKVPDWFTHQSWGTSITIDLPLNWRDSIFKGFAVGLVVAFHDYCERAFIVECYCCFANDYGDEKDLAFRLYSWDDGAYVTRYVGSDHVFVWYDHKLSAQVSEICDWFSDDCFTEASFEFYPCDFFGNIVDLDECCEVIQCAIFPLHALDEENKQLGMEMAQTLSTARLNLVDEASKDKRCREDLSHRQDDDKLSGNSSSDEEECEPLSKKLKQMKGM